MVSVITMCNLIKRLYGKPVKRDWVEKVVFPIQILLIFDGRWIRYLWDVRLKIYRLPILNMLFQFVRTVLGFIESWSRDQLMQKA